MQKSLKILQAAQQALNKLDADRAAEDDRDLEVAEWRSRILYTDLGNGLHVEYFGEVWHDAGEGAFEIALNAICQPEIAQHLTSLSFTGDDEGANGSRTHEFNALLASKATFPNLKNLIIRPTDVANHNFCDVAQDQLPALITRCPNLQSLTIPHAPEPAFFDVQLKELCYLRIGMGWQLHDFIAHLAKKSNMPNLTVLDFSDSLSVFEAKIPKDAPPTPPDLSTADDLLKNLGYDNAQIIEMQKMTNEAFAKANVESRFDDNFTSFENYCALFASPALKKGAVFHLRNAYLTEEQFLALQKMRPDLQFSLSIEAPHVYVSHWQGKFSKPYQHLIINKNLP